MKALVEGGEVVEALRERVLGRTLIADLVHPETQDVLYPSGSLLDEDAVDAIDNLGIDEVKVRTALSCDTRWGVCAKCYGRDLGRGSLVNVGEAIGVIARSRSASRARSSRCGPSTSAAPRRGPRCRATSRRIGRHGALHRHDALSLERQGRQGGDQPLGRSHDRRRQRPRARAPQGAVRRDAAGVGRRPGARGQAARRLGPAPPPIITEYAGTVKFEHVEEGSTVAKQIDDVTGLSTLVVIDAKRRTTAAARASVRR
jgi:DNA-directed RNA polymerase subunit beta'